MKHRLFFHLLVFIFLHHLISNVVFSKSNDSIPSCEQTDALKILSWNIFMLPTYFFESEYKFRRAYKIAEVIEKLDYHIVVFQEAFHSTIRSAIARYLKDAYPYQYGPANKSLTRFNSGIWIISKIPLYNADEIKYRRRSGIDALANKGALLMEGCWQGHNFQIIGTHLQASGTYEVRKAQLEQLYDELLKPNEKNGIPQFICGDMNICYKNCIEYESMLRILDAENEDVIDENMGTNRKGDRIDYIFHRKNGHEDFYINRIIHVISNNPSNKSTFLSDHYAIGAIIQFKHKKECSPPSLN